MFLNSPPSSPRNNKHKQNKCIKIKGTYKIKSSKVRQCTLDAIKCGYRCFDTAFIYGGETTEKQVGLAIQDAIYRKHLIKDREELFVITKQWRKYHGYQPTLQCLEKSLRRLQLDYIDLYLIHWPGPAYKTMNRRNDLLEKYGPWYYAAKGQQDEASMPYIRSETWRAMEDAYFEGKVHSIGVSNFTIEHLETLKQTARIWPPAVLQIECHPLLPQTELLQYCQKEKIVVQAYASLGGQDTGTSRKYWNKLYPPVSLSRSASTSSSAIDVMTTERNTKKEGKISSSSAKTTKSPPPPIPRTVTTTTTNLCTTPPVQQLAFELNKTPSQILLRWAIDQDCCVIPKTEHVNRMVENANIFDFNLKPNQIHNQLTARLQQRLNEQILLSPSWDEEQEKEQVKQQTKVTTPSHTAAVAPGKVEVMDNTIDDDNLETKCRKNAPTTSSGDEGDNKHGDYFSSDQVVVVVRGNAKKAEAAAAAELGRLCWKRDPLRMLDFA